MAARESDTVRQQPVHVVDCVRKTLQRRRWMAFVFHRDAQREIWIGPSACAAEAHLREAKPQRARKNLCGAVSEAKTETETPSRLGNKNKCMQLCVCADQPLVGLRRA